MYLINSSGDLAATGTLWTANVANETGVNLWVYDNGGGGGGGGSITAAGGAGNQGIVVVITY